MMKNILPIFSPASNTLRQCCHLLANVFGQIIANVLKYCLDAQIEPFGRKTKLSPHFCIFLKFPAADFFGRTNSMRLLQWFETKFSVSWQHYSIPRLKYRPLQYQASVSFAK
jgi:hypothetical protein